MGEKKELDLRTKELIKGLSYDDENLVLKTLNEIEEEGNELLIIPLINLGVKREEESIREQVEKILFNLKISSSHPIILNELEKMEKSSFRRVVIAAVWNANINGLSHLDTFVRIAIEGDFYEAVECLTVIEESEGELIEEKILDSLILLKRHMGDEKNANDPKKTILESIQERVETLNQGHL